jgi:hypothetical protein
MLTAAQIQAAPRRPIEAVRFAELGGEVGFCAVSPTELAGLGTAEDSIDGLCAFLALTLCDDRGESLYSDETKDQLKDLGYRTLLAMAETGKRINCLDEESRQELRKNLRPART